VSRQVRYQLAAMGSTDAVGKAKQAARAEGLRIQTVASVRPFEPDTSRGTELAQWVVVLAVRDEAVRA